MNEDEDDDNDDEEKNALRETFLDLKIIMISKNLPRFKPQNEYKKFAEVQT